MTRDLIALRSKYQRRPTGTQKMLRDFIAERAQARGFTASDIARQDRTARLANARSRIMAEAYFTGRWSFMSLAKGFERDHSTIVHAVQKARALAQREAA